MKLRIVALLPVLLITLLLSTSSLAMAKSHKTGPLVKLGGNATLGKFLVTRKGFTLYHNVFENGGKIACTGKCLKLWHPYLLPRGMRKPTAGRGVTDKLGIVHRKFGKQLTYDGWMLYRFVGDHKPGETRGQSYPNAYGKQYWFVVSPAPMVTFTVNISSAGGVGYGTVTLSYMYHGQHLTQQCSSASCPLAVHADVKVNVSETPTNSTLATFSGWEYGPVHSHRGITSKKTSFNVKSRDDYTINATYTPVA